MIFLCHFSLHNITMSWKVPTVEAPPGLTPTNTGESSCKAPELTQLPEPPDIARRISCNNRQTSDAGESCVLQ